MVTLLLWTFVSACLLAQSPNPGPAKSQTPIGGFVTVNGVKLHYIDWGGHGPTVLFLAGFRDTAQVFDEFAPQFTDRFHVLGLTRRGFGESDKPPRGYDAGTRVEDIRQFLEALSIRKVSLIGHSMAGDELTLFATRYPERVAKLVYLDAAYDRTPESWIAGLSDPTNRPGIIQRMRMEALGLPGASEIPVEKMPPPEAWAILVAITRRYLLFGLTTQKCGPRHSPFMPSQQTPIIRRIGCQRALTRTSAPKRKHGGGKRAMRSCGRAATNSARKYLMGRSSSWTMRSIMYLLETPRRKWRARPAIS